MLGIHNLYRRWQKSQGAKDIGQSLTCTSQDLNSQLQIGHIKAGKIINTFHVSGVESVAIANSYNYY